LPVSSNINGETAKLAAAIYKKQKERNTTLAAGVRWDQMNRIIVWKVHRLPPSETLEARTKISVPGVPECGKRGAHPDECSWKQQRRYHGHTQISRANSR
jgi:hypothetical protein